MCFGVSFVLAPLRVLRGPPCSPWLASPRGKYMTRIGIIGLGFMGRMHYDTYAKIPGAQVVAVCDADPQAGRGRPLRRVGQHRRRRHASSCRWTASRGTPTRARCSANPDVRRRRRLPADAGPRGRRRRRRLAAGQARAVREADGPHRRRGAQDRRGRRRRRRGCSCRRCACGSGPSGSGSSGPSPRSTTARCSRRIFRRVGVVPAGVVPQRADVRRRRCVDLHVHDTDFVYHLFGKPHGVFSRGYRGGSGRDRPRRHPVPLRRPRPRRRRRRRGRLDAWPTGSASRCSTRSNFEHATADFDIGRKDDAACCTATARREPVEHGEARRVHRRAELLPGVRPHAAEARPRDGRRRGGGAEDRRGGEEERRERAGGGGVRAADDAFNSPLPAAAARGATGVTDMKADTVFSRRGLLRRTSLAVDRRCPAPAACFSPPVPRRAASCSGRRGRRSTSATSPTRRACSRCWRSTCPDDEVTLWPNPLSRRGREAAAAPLPEARGSRRRRRSRRRALAACDFFLHGSGPGLVGAAEMERWRQAGKPYGFAGVTLSDDELKAHRDLLAGAKFVFSRDTDSLRRPGGEPASRAR